MNKKSAEQKTVFRLCAFCFFISVFFYSFTKEIWKNNYCLKKWIKSEMKGCFRDKKKHKYYKD